MTITYHKTVTKHKTNFEFFQLSHPLWKHPLPLVKMMSSERFILHFQVCTTYLLVELM